LHHDGDLAGRTLARHYGGEDSAKREALMALGGLSDLGSEIGEQHPFFDDDPTRAAWCTAYGRDRGEPGNDPVWISDWRLVLREAMDWNVEYVYLWVESEKVWRKWKMIEGSGRWVETDL
jgi:hypothetical protein